LLDDLLVISATEKIPSTLNRKKKHLVSMSIIDLDVTITQQKYANTIMLSLLTIPCIGKASTRCDLIWIFRASRLPAKSIHTYTA
jgi:hypothetical protein